MSSRPEARRPRAREAGIQVGRIAPGPLNAITDVAGVAVGHRTLRSEDGRARTGVTAILPNPNTYYDRVLAGAYALNGAGEVSGLLQVYEWGVIETPILLTNTLSVGKASDACIQWLVKRHPEIGHTADVPIPLVGECDDSWLSDITGRHLKGYHIQEALDRAKTGPVPEGSVGGGTGMITCDFKAGIGTASRLVEAPGGPYTFGVLVQSNFGRMEDLRLDGISLGPWLAERYSDYARRRENYGSIIVVFATDAPLLPAQLTRVAKRCALGIGRMGSIAAHGSGEIILGFTTANTEHRKPSPQVRTLHYIPNQHTEHLYEAAIEATSEAILNALFAADEMTGYQDHYVPGLPIPEVLKFWNASRP